MVAESVRVWREQVRRTDVAIGTHPTLDEVGEGNGFSVRWNLAKLIGGHADLLRERLDGQRGE